MPPDASQPVRAFYVRDNGIGVWSGQQDARPEEGARQEDIVRRLPEPGGRGAGAGLTISHRIVERHGGRLWVRSAPEHAPEQGTTFYFTV